MKPLSLRLVNFIGIRSGLGREELELDFSDLTGLVALVGPNGHGKTTVLDNMHPYRLMPFRAGGYSERTFSYYEETFGDALKELVWRHAGHVYRSVIAIKGTGKVKRTSATLYREDVNGEWQPARLPDGTVSDGKTETYDACVHAIVGSPEMFFTAAFSAQDRTRLCDYAATDIKLVLAELLRLHELLELSDKAAAAAKYLTAQAEGLSAQLQSFEADTAAAGLKRTEIAEASRAIAEQATRRAQLRAAATTAAQALAVEQAKVGQEAQYESERQRLVLERMDIEAEGKRQLDALDIAIKAKVKEGVAEDLCTARDQANSRLVSLTTRRGRLVSASSFTTTQADAEAAVAKATESVSITEAQLNLARGQHLEASQAAAQVGALTSKLAGLKREGSTARANLDAATRRGQLLSRVPCADMEIASTCELLADARTGKAQEATLAKEVEALLKDYRASEAELAELRPRAAAAADHAAEVKRLESDLTGARQRLAAAQADVAKAIAAEAARTELQEVDDSIDAERATLRATQQQIALRADEADAAAQALRDQIPQTRAATAERLKRVDDALAAIPEANDGKAMAAAQKAAQQAEQQLADLEVTIGSEQSRAARLEAEAAVLEQRLASAEDVRKKALHTAEQIGLWRLLSKALGKDGVVALAIDDAGPSISSLTNDLLLDCYGPRFTVSFQTQTAKADGSLREDFAIMVFDGDRGDEKDLVKTSGGERIWLNEAITRAIGLHRAREIGAAYECLFSDESDGALDPKHKAMFMAMKRKVLELGGADTEFYITHTPELWAMADHVIDFTALKA